MSGLQGALVLIDDILVFGKDKEEHNVRLTAVLQKIQKAGITLNEGKCQFGRKSLKFLGHVIDKEGIKADPDKTAALVQMEQPRDISGVRRFLGMANQLHKDFKRATQ